MEMRVTPSARRLDRGAVHSLCASPFTLASLRSFFLNISSMRWVTRKPPNTLIAAKRHGDRAEIAPKSTSREPAARMAPTMITAEMALVTDISGVCSAGRDIPDHVIADEDRQHEHGEIDDGRIDCPVMDFSCDRES